MSSQVLWKQAWNSEAESAFARALASVGCSLHELPSQQRDPKTWTIGGIKDVDATYLAPASDAWSSAMLHLNSLNGEPIAGELSRLTGGPAIVLLEYDQDTWGYCLFDGGVLIDRFWSVPEAVDMSPEDCPGNAETVSSIFTVPLEMVAPYVQQVENLDPESKAFEDDEFTLGDHWVRVDFMRRLGLLYPNPGKVPGGRYVSIDEPK